MVILNELIAALYFHFKLLLNSEDETLNLFLARLSLVASISFYYHPISKILLLYHIQNPYSKFIQFNFWTEITFWIIIFLFFRFCTWNVSQIKNFMKTDSNNLDAEKKHNFYSYFLLTGLLSSIVIDLTLWYFQV